jgi:hypothetical protein
MADAAELGASEMTAAAHPGRGTLEGAASGVPLAAMIVHS